MGMTKDVLVNPFINLIKMTRNDERYNVEENRLDATLEDSMRAKGKARVSQKDATLLSNTNDSTNLFAKEIADRQEKSIIVYASDMVVRARNVVELWIKKIKANKKLATQLDKNFASKGDLPKDATVIAAEATNGKGIEVDARNIGNTPRAKGGRGRSSQQK